MTIVAASISMVASVLFWATNFVPVKAYPAGDGMFYQLTMAIGIFLVGLAVQLMRDSPPFDAVAMIGGIMWATGNIFCVTIVETIGLGMGMLLWGLFNTFTGWACGFFGILGVSAQAVPIPGLNIAGVVVVALGASIMSQLNPTPAVPANKTRESDEASKVADNAAVVKDGVPLASEEASAAAAAPASQQPSLVVVHGELVDTRKSAAPSSIPLTPLGKRSAPTIATLMTPGVISSSSSTSSLSSMASDTPTSAAAATKTMLGGMKNSSSYDSLSSMRGAQHHLIHASSSSSSLSSMVRGSESPVALGPAGAGGALRGAARPLLRAAASNKTMTRAVSDTCLSKMDSPADASPSPFDAATPDRSPVYHRVLAGGPLGASTFSLQAVSEEAEAAGGATATGASVVREVGVANEQHITVQMTSMPCEVEEVVVAEVAEVTEVAKVADDAQVAMPPTAAEVASTTTTAAPHDADVNTSKWVRELKPAHRKAVGISLAIFAGMLFGGNFNPVQHQIDLGAPHSTNPLDYVFSHFVGILLAATAYFLIYCGVKRNQPVMNPQLALPGIVSGAMWGIAQASFFIANGELQQVVVTPICAITPGVVASVIGVVFYKEMPGRRNMIVLLASIVVAAVGIIMIALSKTL